MTRQLADVRDDNDLRACILNDIPHLQDEISTPEFWADSMMQLRAVFEIRRWVVGLCNYSGPELLLDPVPRGDVASVTFLLTRHKIGLWCAGVSTYFSEILRLLGFAAGNLVYGYGGDLHHLGHTTTLIGIHSRVDGRGRYDFYNIDAYLCYHFVDTDAGFSGPPLTFAEIVRRIKRKEHNSITIIDERIERDLITPPGHDPAFRSWLFDGDLPPSSTVLPSGAIITPGASHSISKLFPEGSPMWKLAQQVKEERTMHEWMLDWILVNPWIEEMGPPCVNQTSRCLANVVLMRQFLEAAMEGNR